jgi:hypothetical protein
MLCKVLLANDDAPNHVFDWSKLPKPQLEEENKVAEETGKSENIRQQADERPLKKLRSN